MKTITVIFSFLPLIIGVFLSVLIIGGVDKAYAKSYDERAIYEVSIENNSSKVLSNMAVFANSEKQAREFVELNGWTVLGVKRLTEKEVRRFEFSVDSVNSITPKQVSIDSALNAKQIDPILREPEQTSGANLPDGYPKGLDGVDIYAKEPDKPQNNFQLTPDSKEIVKIMTLHFELGNVKPIINNGDIAKIRALIKNERYIVFGHADDVRVGVNADYGSNFELSYRRAEYIKMLLAQNGISEYNISEVGLGTRFPVDLTSKNGSLANRRVEIYGFRKEK